MQAVIARENTVILDALPISQFRRQACEKEKRVFPPPIVVPTV